MHSLLERQIRKYLPDSLKDADELAVFIEAINKSYSNFDEKNSMVQRAMNISSDELFKANQDLRAETENQKKTLNILEKAIALLNINNEDDATQKSLKIQADLDPLALASKIEKQANDIVKMTAEKNKMVKDAGIHRKEKGKNDRQRISSIFW